MSSSDDDSKIDMLDSASQVKKKIKKAFCEPGNITENGVLAFVKQVLMPLSNRNDFVVERSEEHGGCLKYESYAELEAAFEKMDVHPGDLKSTVEKQLNKLMDPVRKEFGLPELVKLTKAAYPPKNVKKTGDEINPGRLDLRVGKILSVEKHPEAETLYVETVDIGESRTVVSGLVGKVAMEELQDRMGVFLCNLKPAKMKGVMSQAMLLCAANPETGNVEPLDAPVDSVPGEKVFIDGFKDMEPDNVLNPKKKVWEALQKDFRINLELIAEWQGTPLMTEKGAIKCKSLTGALIS